MTTSKLVDDTWIPLAEVARPHGVKGELRLRLFNKTSDTLLAQDEVLVRMADGEEHEVSVDGARRADDAILMKLHSVDDRDRAEDLRGATICVRRRDFPTLGEGEFYEVDVVGAEVRLDDERIGEVIEIVSYPSVSAVRVRADEGGHYEIPLVEAFVANVSAAERLVTLVTLEGIERETPKVRKPKAPKGERGAASGDESGVATTEGDAAHDADADPESE